LKKLVSIQHVKSQVESLFFGKNVTLKMDTKRKWVFPKIGVGFPKWMVYNGTHMENPF